MVTNVLTFLEQAAVKEPTKKAVADEQKAYTYPEFYELTKKAGAYLSQYTGVRKPVAVYMEKSADTLALFMGAVHAGCFYCLLDPTQPAERTKMILNTLEAELLVVNQATLKKVEKLSFSGKVLVIDDALNYEYTELDLSRLTSIRNQMLDIDPLYSNFTSGSTGVPKGVVVNHRSVIDFIEYFTEVFNITGQDIIGNQAPFDFDVSVKDIYSAFSKAATLQIIPKKYFSFPTKLMDYLDENEVTTLVWAVSALCIVTTLKSFEYRKPSCINKVIFSGEVMPIKHLTQWQDAYPEAMFVNVYGPTEITCNCTYYVIDRKYELDEKIPIGKAFPNERVFLLDEEDHLIDEKCANKQGEICVSGTCVTLGYFNNKEKTDAAFVQNPLNHQFNEIIYRTGDLAYYDVNGDLVYSSRKDFQIKYMGHRIELGEIELAINAVDGIRRSCVIYDHENSRIYAFFEGENERKAIVAEIKKKLPAFMIPHEFIKVEIMPLNKNGKIDRKELMGLVEKKN